jgi:hypothetical protein
MKWKVKISRPCYDKYRRCPGWAGPGWKSHREDSDYWCDNGFIKISGKRFKSWKFHRCTSCKTWVWPYNFRYLMSWRCLKDELIIRSLERAACNISRTDWDENWRSWPHCNIWGGGCAMYFWDKEAHCDCTCRWCKLARRFRPNAKGYISPE